jgi:hypothetical protein
VIKILILQAPFCGTYVSAAYVVAVCTGHVLSSVRYWQSMVVSLAFKEGDTGIKVQAHPCRLVYRWSGVNHKTTTMTVTFACAMCRGPTKK